MSQNTGSVFTVWVEDFIHWLCHFAVTNCDFSGSEPHQSESRELIAGFVACWMWRLQWNDPELLKSPSAADTWVMTGLHLDTNAVSE